MPRTGERVFSARLPLDLRDPSVHWIQRLRRVWLANFCNALVPVAVGPPVQRLHLRRADRLPGGPTLISTTPAASSSGYNPSGARSRTPPRRRRHEARRKLIVVDPAAPGRTRADLGGARVRQRGRPRLASPVHDRGGGTRGVRARLDQRPRLVAPTPASPDRAPTSPAATRTLRHWDTATGQPIIYDARTRRLERDAAQPASWRVHGGDAVPAECAATRGFSSSPTRPAFGPGGRVARWVAPDGSSRGRILGNPAVAYSRGRAGTAHQRHPDRARPRLLYASPAASTAPAATCSSCGAIPRRLRAT